VLLRDLPAPDDPVLGSLLVKRPIIEPLLYTVGRLLPRLIGRIDARGVEHLPATGAFAICPNHQSYVDVFFLLGVVPNRTLADLFFVGAVEYFETPLMAWIARRVNIVPVDPDSNLVPAMKAGAFGLSHGKVLMLFPEGERSIDGTVKRFKKGAPILARHLDVPIIPVAIRGAHEVWPRGRAFNWRTLLPWSRRTVHIRFGPPFRVNDGESYTDAANRLRQVVQTMWENIETPRS
jgi:long-chain acyl-CoA synthetase